MRFRSETRWDYARQAITAVVALAHFALPQIGFARRIGGTSAIMDASESPAVPPPWTFAIWGVIFAWTLLFALWQALPGNAKSSFLRAVGPWAAASLTLSALWSLCAMFAPFWTTLAAMSALYVSLAITCAAMRKRPESAMEAARWLGRRPFELFFGWIALALPANAAAVMREYGLTVFADNPQLDVFVLFALAALTVYAGLAVTRGAAFFAFAAAWGAGALLFDNSWANWRPEPAAASAALLLFLLAAERWIASRRAGGFARRR